MSASPNWDFDYVRPFNVPDFNVFDIHTRRPYKAKPAMEEIQLYNRFNDDGSYNTTLLFDSTRALARFRTLLTHPEPWGGEATGPESSVDAAPLNYLHEIVLTIHEQLNEESLGFVVKVFDRATDTVHIPLLSSTQAFTYNASGCTQP